MELDVRLDAESLSIPIADPFRMDVDAVAASIESFLAARGARAEGLDLRGLLPRMMKGIAGCEAGCPSDAKGFVSRGFPSYRLEYIEGGILSAAATTADGRPLRIRMFPDF